MASQRVYWAAEPDIQQLAARALERFAWHISALKTSGRWDDMRAALSAYYGFGVDGERDSSRLQDADDAVDLHINAVRPVVNNALSLIAGQRPKVTPRSINDDAKSQAQARFAKALHDYYDTRTDADTREMDVTRGGLLASSWSLGHAWMPRDGKEWAIGPDGTPVYEGDVDTFALPPWRCVWDFSTGDQERRKWVLFRRPLPRWDTAAQFDEMAKGPDGAKYARKAQQVRDAAADSPGAYQQARGGVLSRFGTFEALLGEVLPDEDVVWVWELRHLPSPALPRGRLVRFLEPDVCLWDSEELGVVYPYADLHVYEYAPERVVSSAAGHTATFDLLAGQEFLDLCTTSMASTINVNGQNRFWSPNTEGGAQVRGLGLNGAVIETSAKPEVLDFPALKPEVVAAADWVLGQMRQAMALNNTVMGQPDKGMPASAQALQRAQAVQYHAVSQAEYVKLVSRAANGRLKLLKRFAKSPRIAQIGGQSRAYELKEWTASDLELVDRFDVEPIDPLTTSREARQAFGELLVTRGLLSPDGFLSFMQTGNLEAETATKRAQKELVEANVALLQRGIGPGPVDIQASMASGSPVFVDDGQEHLRLLKSDPHHLAVPAYLGVLASPTSRDDAKVFRAASEAIQLSLELWATLTPDEAMAFGVPPLPSQLAMVAPPGAPPLEGASPETPGGDEPDMPAPPENPLTGEKAPASDTGLPS